MLLLTRTKWASLGTIPNSSALWQIGGHWIEKYFHLICIGIKKRVAKSLNPKLHIIRRWF
jgi:hypothetical protein